MGMLLDKQDHMLGKQDQTIAVIHDRLSSLADMMILDF